MKTKFGEYRPNDLRFPSSYQQATGQRLKRSDFEPDNVPHKRDVVFWCIAAAVICSIAYVLR